ncbi:MAG: glycosyltransferase [Deltaproteobacteria bacterium]|nr:glycosyltransferase [Deltaproteobacteria bacterium]
MQKDSPIITVIIAALNNAKFFEQCLQSITTQTYPQKELIVIDGGSTDETLSIIKSHKHRITYWESEPDRGIYHAWNKALKHAHGDWMCFLGADDYLWNRQVFTDLVPHLMKAEKSGIKIVYGQVARVNSQGHILKLMGKPWEKIGWLMTHGMPLPHTGLMHHRSLFEIHGVFDETFQIAGDYEILLRELKKGKALFADGLITTGWRSGGISESRFLFAHREIAQARRRHGFRGFSWVWLAVHCRGFVREYWRRLFQNKRPPGK